ncbi:hypothetical protein A4G20_03050 [Pasteurellaceae bacterium RH1A]|nr:hypothetical protein A4G20_03050 [Pasteurellaceae bacterium RH1A]
MKKLIALTSILALSGAAFANTSAVETANQAASVIASPAAPSFGPKGGFERGERDGRKHEGKEKRFDRESRDHKDRKDRKDRKETKGPQGGFFDESLAAKNLADAKNAKDNTPFIIEGHIIKQVGKNDFIFKDLQGNEHEVEVSKRAWQGKTITPADKIKIEGKIDSDWGKTEIEVKRITTL